MDAANQTWEEALEEWRKLTREYFGSVHPQKREQQHQLEYALKTGKTKLLRVAIKTWHVADYNRMFREKQPLPEPPPLLVSADLVWGDWGKSKRVRMYIERDPESGIVYARRHEQLKGTGTMRKRVYWDGYHWTTDKSRDFETQMESLT